METKDLKICVALCTNRLVQPLTTISLMHLIEATDLPLHILLADRGYNIAENRSYAVIQAKKNNCSHILFVDDDMTFEGDILDKLLALKKEIVGVNSYSRVLPLRSTVGLMDENGEYMSPEKYPFQEIPAEPFKAMFVGGGVMLIDMKVFEKLEKPYFAFEADQEGMITEGEDGYFCRKAREKGIEIWCEPSVKVGHLGIIDFSRDNKNFYGASI